MMLISQSCLEVVRKVSRSEWRVWLNLGHEVWSSMAIRCDSKADDVAIRRDE